MIVPGKPGDALKAGGGLAAITSMRAPSPTDHVALRTLMKYLSAIHNIPYKSICAGTKFDESGVKNYTNDKSSRSLRANEMYAAFSGRCAELISERSDIPLDDFVIAILLHLFGDQWLKSAKIKLPRSPHDHSLDETLAKWLAIAKDETDEVERRYRGLWTVLRASSSPGDLKEISYSLLNIRPRGVTGGTLCDFRWYHLGKGRERDERRVFEGFVIPNVDRIEFLGRVTTRHKLLTLMVWRFTADPEFRDHATVASGVSLSLNTSGGPVGARVRAFFIGGSDGLEGAEFEAVKNEQLAQVGVKPIESLQSQIPADQVQATLAYLSEHKPIVGFFPAGNDPFDN